MLRPTGSLPCPPLEPYSIRATKTKDYSISWYPTILIRKKNVKRYPYRYTPQSTYFVYCFIKPSLLINLEISSQSDHKLINFKEVLESKPLNLLPAYKVSKRKLKTNKQNKQKIMQDST